MNVPNGSGAFAGMEKRLIRFRWSAAYATCVCKLVSIRPLELRYSDLALRAFAANVDEGASCVVGSAQIVIWWPECGGEVGRRCDRRR